MGDSSTLTFTFIIGKPCSFYFKQNKIIYKMDK